jgi:hypothetical protein
MEINNPVKSQQLRFMLFHFIKTRIFLAWILLLFHTSIYAIDLTISDTPGDIWNCSFTGSEVSVIAPKEPGDGKIEVIIDGEICATVDLSTTGIRRVQQAVCKISGLNPGKHTINIVNQGPGRVAIDAIIVQEKN